MIRIVVNGVAGRMGREVMHLALADPEFIVVGAFEAADSPLLGRRLREVFGESAPDLEITAQRKEALSGADAAVDFSTPEATLSLIRLLSGMKLALVIGTTGFTEEEANAIRELANQHAVLLAPNMSSGINAVFAFLPALLSRLGEGWDVEICEHHHRGKVDSPSGTALRLGEIVADCRGKPLESLARFGREGKVGPRGEDEICFHSIRGGGVPGEHSLIFSKGEEEVVLTHRVYGRRSFARGSLLAARRLVGKKPGLYRLEDLTDD